MPFSALAALMQRIEGSSKSGVERAAALFTPKLKEAFQVSWVSAAFQHNMAYTFAPP